MKKVLWACGALLATIIVFVVGSIGLLMFSDEPFIDYH